MAGGMELRFLRALKVQISEPENLAKIPLSVEFLRDEKNLGHSEKKILNIQLQGHDSELNSLYFPRKTP